MWLPDRGRGNEFGALLADLSKAFDFINHPLLLAKLYNYEVSPLSINMIFSIWAIEHRTKINDCFSERSRIEHGVPQGSKLGPLLFNIDLIDLFYKCEENNFASHAMIQPHIFSQGTLNSNFWIKIYL